MTEPIIAQFMLPITTKETVQELMQKGVDWGKTIGAIEELEKIKAEIECNMRKNNCDLYGYADSLVIIDKEIAELKGE